MSKILYVASTYSHIKSFHLEYIKALRAAGHEVLIMANGSEADFNIPFEKKIFSRRNSVCRKEIAKIVSEEHFDAILLNTTLAAFHVRLALKGKKRPRVVNFVHGYLFSKKSPFVKKTVFLFCEKLLAKKTDAIIVMNSEDRDVAKRKKLTRGEVYMTRGMGINPLVPTKSREQMRSELGFDGKTVISYVGELSKRKNQEFLIRALKKLKLKHPDLLLALVGDGDEKENLLSLTCELSLTDSVKFMGRREDVADILNATDIYASAAKSEGLPFNIAEALSLGLPVIASDVKGQNDIIENRSSGILYSSDSMEEFTAAISKVYAGDFKPDKENTLAAYRKFSFSEVFLETLTVITEALDL